MTDCKREVLPVIFRAEKAGDHAGEVTAVFPTLPGTNDLWTFTTYAHVGQHGTGAYGWYLETRPATPDEYADLLRELRHIYEEGGTPEPAVELKICSRFTQRHDRARRDALRRAGR